jgi:hypothetical protein
MGCVQAAAIAEREAGVPAGLLLAIGRIESGRFDPLSGTLVPAPFAVNAAGEPRFFGDAASAATYVEALERQGVRSIDVGCFQVSLLYHPDAFPHPADGFDALANARFAAGLLARLAARSGSWQLAAALYHSATPGLGEPYAARVFASWHGRAPLPLPEWPGGWPGGSPRAWAGGWVGAVQVRVIVPGAPQSAWNRSTGRLPRVITPGSS